MLTHTPPTALRFVLCSLSTLMLSQLTACSGEVIGGDFNLNPITLVAGQENQRLLNFSWGQQNAAATYTLCVDDPNALNNCQPLGYSVGNNQLTLPMPAFLPYINANFFVLATENNTTTRSNFRALTTPVINGLIQYIKASPTENQAGFGYRVALSGDGSTLAIGNFQGQAQVEIYRYQPAGWALQQVVSPAQASTTDEFGHALAFSQNGNLLLIGADLDDSDSTGINGANNNNALNSGAAYLFNFDGSNWQQEAYIKASNTDVQDRFGYAVSISADGSTLAIGAIGESSNLRGITTTPVTASQTNNNAPNSGAVYLFNYDGQNWQQTAFIKSSNSDEFDSFGSQVSLNANGTQLAASSPNEDSNATGVNGNQNNNQLTDAGAVYVFLQQQPTGTWQQQAYIKAFNPDPNDNFGASLALSGDASTLVVGAPNEDSSSANTNNGAYLNDLQDAGAAYVFRYNGSQWAQQAYLKLPSQALDNFGALVAISYNGDTVAVSTPADDIQASGINGANQGVLYNLGAAYLFQFTNNKWQKSLSFKPLYPDAGDKFGQSLSLSGGGNLLAVGAPGDDSSDVGLNGQADNNNIDAGAVYLF